mgnify:CR=1 FL=1
MAQAQRQLSQAEQHYQIALALKIEFNDRYSQARTYHMIGLLMQDLEQLEEAARAMAQALIIWSEYQDEHYKGVALRNLRRLYQTHPDEMLLHEVAAVLGSSMEEVRGWMTTAGE